MQSLNKRQPDSSRRDLRNETSRDNIFNPVTDFDACLNREYWLLLEIKDWRFPKNESIKQESKTPNISFAEISSRIIVNHILLEFVSKIIKCS